MNPFSDGLNPLRARAKHRFNALALLITALLPVSLAYADDWPQWMGPQRDGVWRESGILDQFPEGGPKVLWRVPVRAGYVGPAVAGNRLFLLDRVAGKMPERKPGDRSLPLVPGNERVICLDTSNGQLVWERTDDCAYAISYPAGPRATPVVHEGRLYTLGAMGHLRCLKADTGEQVWVRDLPKEYGVEPPAWGYAAHPLLDGDRLICLVGGTNSAVVAFHRETGRELWRALGATEIGYAPPVLHAVEGVRQLVIWHPDAVAGLVPDSGQVLWTHPYPVGGKPQRPEVTIALPRLDGDRLFLTSFYQGSLLLRLPAGAGEASVIWNRRSRKQSEKEEGLHTVMSTPTIMDGHIYGVCAFGEMRCLELETGDRRWESLELFSGKGGFFAHAFSVRQGDRHFFWNDQGELLIGTLSPQRLHITSRARLLDPVENTRGRDVLWCHPAFAHRRAYMHNGRELICVSLAATDDKA